MTEQRVSLRYARALLETVQKEGMIETVKSDFVRINQVVESSRELRNAIDSPILQHWRKVNLFKEVFANMVSPVTLNFLLLLTDKGREQLLPDIIAQFNDQYNKIMDRLPVEIISALELTPVIKEKVVEKLTDYTKKTILPEFKINPEIKGGIVVKIEDWVYDASLKNQLNLLYKQLTEGGLFFFGKSGD